VHKQLYKQHIKVIKKSVGKMANLDIISFTNVP